MVLSLTCTRLSTGLVGRRLPVSPSLSPINHNHWLIAMFRLIVKVVRKYELNATQVSRDCTNPRQFFHAASFGSSGGILPLLSRAGGKSIHGKEAWASRKYAFALHLSLPSASLQLRDS
jgi:hypothetical protein